LQKTGDSIETVAVFSGKGNPHGAVKISGQIQHKKRKANRVEAEVY
jgi:hypothetical protein